MKRDFLCLSDLSVAELQTLLRRAHWLKKTRQETGTTPATLQGKTLGLVFEKSSTRTRVSFEVGMTQLGGTAMVLPQSDSQMSRGEPLKDTARVLGRYLDAVVMRTHAHARLKEFAHFCPVPVINGLSDSDHPCQLLADLLTIEERFGTLQGRKIAFVGDATSNMAQSWIEAAKVLNLELRLAAPTQYAAHGRQNLAPEAAVAGADVINTDVWTSMGQEAEQAERVAAFRGFGVDEALLRHASPQAIVMHCLPAHRGEEISEGVLEGKQSVVWDQAENRLHAQKALLELLLSKEPLS